MRLRVRPLTLTERGLGTPTVSLAALLSGERPPISGSTDVSLDDYIAEIVASGLSRDGAPRAKPSGIAALDDGICLDDLVHRGIRIDP